jgi:PAS domain S-box-containing protein
VIDSISEPALLLNSRFAVMHTNQAGADLFECSPASLVGHDFPNLFGLEASTSIRDLLRGLMARKCLIARFNANLIRQDGKVKSVEVIAFATALPHTPSRVVISLKDATAATLKRQEILDDRERLRGLVDSIDDVLFTLDMGGRFTGVFGRWLEQAGWTASTLLGRSAREIVGPENADALERAIQEVLRGRSATYEWNYRIKGADRTVQTTLSPIYDKESRVTAIVGVGRDITAIRRLLDEIQLTSTALEQSPESVIIADRDANIQYVNPTFVHLTGYQLEEVLGKNPRFLQSGLTPRSTYESMWKALTNGRSWSGQLCNRKKSGELYWEQAVIAPITNEHGEVTHYVGTKQDITQLKQAQAESEQASLRFRTAFHGSPIPMILSTIGDGQTLEANEAALRTLAIESMDEVGLGQVDKLLWPSRKSRAKVMQLLVQKGHVDDVIIQVTRADGKAIELLASFNRMMIGSLECVLAHLLDLTEQRRLEHAVRESEASYRAMFESNPQPMWVYDSDTLQFLAVNNAAVRLYGYSREEFLDMTLVDIRPSGEVPRFLEEITFHREPMQDEGVWVHRKKNGELLHVRISSHGATFEGAHARVVLAQDVTAQVLAEDALKKSEQRYRRLFEETTSAVFVSMADGRLIDCNPAFIRLFGFLSRDHALQAHLPDVFLTGQSYADLVNRLTAERIIQNTQLEMRRLDGATITVIASLSASYDDAGRLSGIQAYLVDDTNRRVLERQLTQLQKMESLGTLASGIAHDFNNVLGIILAHIALVPLSIGQKDRLNTVLDAMSKATDRGASLVRQLMTFARMNEPSREMVRTGEIAQELVALIRETFPKIITIDFTSDGPPPVIYADPTQFHQVLLNLCVNARDAISSNGGTISIHLRSWAGAEVRRRLPEATGADYAEIRISDNGCGMDPTTLSRIFEPFFTTKPKGRGTGLGLSTVYGIVKSHDGFIEVESEVGKGTTFHLFFPATPLPGFLTSSVREESVVASGKGRILLIEDEESLREAVKGVFESRGFSVLTAADGEEAVRVFDEHLGEIDVVITDSGLPRRSGMEVVRNIKARKPGMKVLVVTGFLEPDQRRQLRELGVESIIMKPVKPDRVVQEVMSLLQQN